MKKDDVYGISPIVPALNLVSKERVLMNLKQVDSGIHTPSNTEHDIEWIKAQSNLTFFIPMGLINAPPIPHNQIMVMLQDTMPERPKLSVKWWLLSCAAWTNPTDVIPRLASHLMWGEWTRQRYLLIEKCTGYDFDTFSSDMIEDIEILKQALLQYGCKF